ncbi:MAG: GNAT family N-acetyltransferase [Pirellulales bacterium]|jgi:amino-acid N-acetyltransferase
MDNSEVEIVAVGADEIREVQSFLEPYLDDQQLLRRTSLELELLLKHAFKAVADGRIVAFCALEIYSKKLAEIQCLAVDLKYRRRGLGGILVSRCVERAREEKVKELMAISTSDEMFLTCGFDYSLPNQKRALFIQP